MDLAVLTSLETLDPTFTSDSEKLTLFIHELMKIQSYELLGIGEHVGDKDVHDVCMDEWAASDPHYKLRYRMPGCQEEVQLLLDIGPTEVGIVEAKFSVHTRSGSGDKYFLSLSTDKYCAPETSKASRAYQNTSDLVERVMHATLPLERSMGVATPAAALGGQTNKPLGDQRRVGGVGLGSSLAASSARATTDFSAQETAGSRDQATVGSRDLAPSGVRAPGQDRGSSLLEGGVWEGQGGGGSQVGPNDPMFGRLRRGGPSGSAVPGARWDPIAPPGLRGFEPEDVARGGGMPGPLGGGFGEGGVPDPLGGGFGEGGMAGPRLGGMPGVGGRAEPGLVRPPGPMPPSRPMHPDIMPPGPGRGTNWDSYFG